MSLKRSQIKTREPEVRTRRISTPTALLMSLSRVASCANWLRAIPTPFAEVKPNHWVEADAAERTSHPKR